MPIESDDHVMRARRTAALTRVAVGAFGVALVAGHWHELLRPVVALVGFALIAVTSLVQFAGPRLRWSSVEESLSSLAGLLIIGLGRERVGVFALLWLVAIASGVLARGGRVHWLGRSLVLASLALPVADDRALSVEYAVFCAATIGLLLTSGRVTRELNLLLREAHQHAENAETLLFAGDLAARMSEHATVTGGWPHAVDRRNAPQPHEQAALDRVLRGEGLSAVVQPIVDVRNGTVHAYEALARFERPLGEAGPLDWFALAERLGQRGALERACLKLGLELFASRPHGTLVSVNISAPVLLDALTASMLLGAPGAEHDLDGLIIEITEETLVHREMDLAEAIAPLRARGARLAVDDVGAGYSGLRQITAVLPSYLKLDRSLITAIDRDRDRAALVGALASYSRQVGSLLVAEGVETGAELRAVQRLGVPLVQGFHFARPGPPWPAVAPVETPELTADLRGDAARETLQPA